MRNSGAAIPRLSQGVAIDATGEKFGMPVISLIDTPAHFRDWIGRTPYFGGDRGKPSGDDEAARALFIAAVIGEGDQAAPSALVLQSVLILEDATIPSSVRKRVPRFCGGIGVMQPKRPKRSTNRARFVEIDVSTNCAEPEGAHTGIIILSPGI